MYIWRALLKYLHISEELFPKTGSLNLALTLDTYFFGMALTAFCKRVLHICLCVYVLLRVYIYSPAYSFSVRR